MIQDKYRDRFLKAVLVIAECICGQLAYTAAQQFMVGSCS